MARRNIKVLFVRLALLRRQNQPKLAEFHGRCIIWKQRYVELMVALSLLINGAIFIGFCSLCMLCNVLTN